MSRFPGREEVVPSGTVTFLFSDIEGSSVEWERDAEAMRSALADHDEQLRRAIGTCRGVVVKHTGDGVMAVFEHPGDALRAAIEAQQTIQRVAVRMGVHTGRAQPEDHGDHLGLTPTRSVRALRRSDTASCSAPRMLLKAKTSLFESR